MSNLNANYGIMNSKKVFFIALESDVEMEPAHWLHSCMHVLAQELAKLTAKESASSPASAQDQPKESPVSMDQAAPELAEKG